MRYLIYFFALQVRQVPRFFSARMALYSAPISPSWTALVPRVLLHCLKCAAAGGTREPIPGGLQFPSFDISHGVFMVPVFTLRDMDIVPCLDHRCNREGVDNVHT